MIRRFDPEPEPEFSPERETEPRGWLVPPRRLPPTAVGVLTPEPGPGPQQRVRFSRLWTSRPSLLGDLVRAMLAAPVVLLLAPVRIVHHGLRSLRSSWKAWQRGRYPRRTRPRTAP